MKISSYCTDIATLDRLESYLVKSKDVAWFITKSIVTKGFKKIYLHTDVYYYD